MRKLIIIAVAAATTAFTFGVPAYADTVRITTSHHGYHRPPHPRHCWTKTVRQRDRHGHVVVRKTRVCR